MKLYSNKWYNDQYPGEKKIWKEAAVSSAKGAQILGAWSCRNL